jgi:hypothetical protein
MLYDWGTISKASPRKLTRDPELAAYLLTPGFTRGYHQHVLGVSNATVWTYTRWARDLAAQYPMIHSMVADNAGSVTREDAILMAQRRGRCHLPFWSRLAICECLMEGDAKSVADLFRCSIRTLDNIRRGGCLAYDPLGGARLLTGAQDHPPASRGHREG